MKCKRPILDSLHSPERLLWNSGVFEGFSQGRKCVPTPVGVMRGRRAGRTGGVPGGYIEDADCESDKGGAPVPAASKPSAPYFPSASEYAAAKLTLPIASMLLGVTKNVVSSGVW